MTCFTTPDQSSMVLQQMFTTNKFTDIALRAGKDGEIIHAHKNVLAASLEYFYLMFSGPFKESSDQEVLIDDIEADILRAVVKFLYLGLVSIPGVKTAIDLWKAAHLMKISALQDHALEYMMDNITSKNCLGLFFLAEQYELGDLSSKTLNYAVRYFTVVIEEDEFKQLSKDEMVKYIAIAQDVTDENEIAKAILEWIEFEESRLKLHFKELLRLLKVNLIDQPVLIDRLYSNCINMEDLKYILKPLHKVLLGNITNVLQPNPEILLIVNYLYNDLNALFLYNVVNDAFVGKSFLQIIGIVVGTWQSKLVILQSVLDKKKVITYDLQRKETVIIGSYAIEECNTCKIVDGDLYLCFGQGFVKINLQNGESKTVKTTDFNIDSFVQFGDRVYFIVYTDLDNDNFWIATYQENEQTWTKVKSFNNPKIILFVFGSAVVHNDCIYYFGDSKLTIYNPKEDICTEGMKYEISGRPKPLSIQNKLFVSKVNSVFEYVDGELKPVSSKLNILDGKYLKLFSLDS